MHRCKKNVIPTNSELLKTKTLYMSKRDPIWTALENEMREKDEKGIKPYNVKVGRWLKFMRARIYNIYMTEKRHYIRGKREAGPAWYFEFSSGQREILRTLHVCMLHDKFAKRPLKTKEALKKLGITLRFPDHMLMRAMHDSVDDAALFFWYLYSYYYKKPPSEPLKRYDENSRYMMSALVFADLEDCKKSLKRVTENLPRPPPTPPKKPKKYFQPNIRYGEYLQKIYVPCVSSHPDKVPKPKKPMPLKNKVKLRSADSYARIAKENNFLELRRQQRENEAHIERTCRYKFWHPPRRNNNPQELAYILKLKMLKQKPRLGFLKKKPPYDCIQYHIKGVSYVVGRPIYHMETIANFPTGYVPINGGYVYLNNEYVLHILGYYRYPNNQDEKCKSECDCVSKRESAVFRYMKETACQCSHFYDFDNEIKPAPLTKRTYFYPPNGTEPYWVDEAKVYQFDDWEDFIKNKFDDVLDSNEDSPSIHSVTIAPSQLKKKDLLAEFLAELSNTPLMIPHLPNANLLKNLQEVVRRKVKGQYSKRKHNNMLRRSKRRWLHLDHVEWYTRAYMIPFTQELLKKTDFSHRPQLQDLFEKLLRDFENRTRKSWLEFTRMFWHTMKYDCYPGQSFFDAFFTYMPVRPIDVHVINPFSIETTPTYGARTCKIERLPILSK